jgi:formylglycine-generating enzyme required for sulfatase activity
MVFTFYLPVSSAGDRQINLFWIYFQNGGIMMNHRLFFILILIATGCGSPAARGVEGQNFPWSNDPLEGSLITGWALEGPTANIGSHQIDKSPYGGFDMGGNIAEWVNDWYAQSYYSEGPEQNPLGPEEGSLRVARGGATSPYPQDMRTTIRRRYRPRTTSRAIGFRCAYDVE